MSLREISKKANVSIATVSRVLNSPDLVTKKTRDLVLKAAEELEYKKTTPFAREIKKNNVIGVLVPEVLNTYFARILEGIMKESKKHNLMVNLALSHDDIDEEYNMVSKFAQANVKGVILIRSTQKYKESIKTTQLLDKANIPYILVDRDIYRGDSSGIFLSNANAVYDAISMLIDNSYKRVGFITGPDGNVNADQRLEGYKSALKSHDIRIDEELIYQCNFDVECGYESALRLLEKKPEAIFSCSNQFTVGTLKAIREKGLKLGKDILVFSFIKLDELNSDCQNISYIDHPIDYMGEKAVTILKNKFVGTKGLIREILNYELIFKN